MIRTIRETDAEAFLKLCKTIDSETENMLYEEGERNLTVEEQKESIRQHLQQLNSTILVAEKNGKLAGYITATGETANRTKHTATISVGVLQSYAGMGLGTRLFEKLEKWAKQAGIVRLELVVLSSNIPAIRLYRKMGFRVEGAKRGACLMDGVLYDDFLMSKLLKRSRFVKRHTQNKDEKVRA
ncbi:GNAT family N-acetyltransferase [Ectobacillus panaciterrae]|uniref:GNAT family N-acetyltransferase n=1 Tax=Ectobacillus panaciterrae TaxID=363872 RepID=UPI0004179032|nr:GNAT family N-acetyltransferase [Ectobacillus panaciterrae]